MLARIEKQPFLLLYLTLMADSFPVPIPPYQMSGTKPGSLHNASPQGRPTKAPANFDRTRHRHSDIGASRDGQVHATSIELEGRARVL